MGTAFLYGNGGTGGTGGTLTVTAPAGVTVTVSKEGKTKTKTAGADGLAVFKGLKSGQWTLTITDGEQTAQKTVTITADYSTEITFFAATIHVTYPAGSTCTATDGVTTLTAPDTSGTWACVVSNVGTWTVTVTDGSDTDSENVSITTDGQNVSVELAYWNGELYDADNRYKSVTGGWTTDETTKIPTIEYSETTMTISAVASGYDRKVRTVNAIDVSDWDTLTFEGTHGDKATKMGLMDESKTEVATVYLYASYTLDISGVTGLCYPYLLVRNSGSNAKIVVSKLQLS